MSDEVGMFYTGWTNNPFYIIQRRGRPHAGPCIPFSHTPKQHQIKTFLWSHRPTRFCGWWPILLSYSIPFQTIYRDHPQRTMSFFSIAIRNPGAFLDLAILVCRWRIIHEPRIERGNETSSREAPERKSAIAFCLTEVAAWLISFGFRDLN